MWYSAALSRVLICTRVVCRPSQVQHAGCFIPLQPSEQQGRRAPVTRVLVNTLLGILWRGDIVSGMIYSHMSLQLRSPLALDY